MKNNIPLTSKENKFFKSWREADKNYATQQHTYNANTVLSNKGYSKLKNGATKTNGSYWKKKLIKANLITVERQFTFIKKCTYKEYLYHKYEVGRNFLYAKGKMYLEGIPSFSLVG